MRAVLLAAGRGTRLAPLTDKVPKILVPLAARTLLAHQLDYLEHNGVTAVAINVHHLADEIVAEIERLESSLEVRVSREPELLGTAGALRPLADFLTGPFFVLYGDVVTTAGLPQLMSQHRRSGALGTLAYYDSTELEGKGLLELARDGSIVGFAEKPTAHDGVGHVNGGIYVLEPRVLEFIEDGEQDFGHDVWPRILAAGETLHAVPIDDYVRDIGSPEDLRLAEADLVGGIIQW